MKKIFESFFLLILILECSSSILYLPNNLTIKIDTPILELSHLKKPSPISSVLVQTGYGLEGLRNCSGINQQLEKKVNGSVAAFLSEGGCTINQFILNAQTHGSIAVVIFEESGWYYARLIQKYKKTGQIKIPTFFIKRSIFNKYIKKRFEKSENITIYLEQSKNDLDKLNEAAIIFFQIPYYFLFFTAIILIMRKIILFLISKEFWFNLQGVVLVLSLLANISSILFMIDPYGVHKMITSYEYFVLAVFKFLFQDQTTVTISFYLVWVLRKFIPRIFLIISFILFILIILGNLSFMVTQITLYLTFNDRRRITEKLTILEVIFYGVMSLYCLTGVFLMAKILNPFINLNSDVQPKKRKEYMIIAICILIFALINFSNFAVHGVGAKYTLHSNVYWRFLSTFIYCFLNGITGITLSFLLKSKVERNKKRNNNRFSFTNGTSRNIQMSSNF